MPDFSYTPKTVNDKSQLTSGWHPAYLIRIADEETPVQWEMAKQSPRLWRWQFAVWETPSHVSTATPELQSTPSTQKFSPGGKYQASKAYVFTRKLLNRQIEPGEHINLETLMPLACQVLITRTDKNGSPIEYANIVDIQPWAQGTELLTPTVRSNLATWFAAKQNGQETTAGVPSQPSTPPAASASPPAGWSSTSTAPASPAPTGKAW